MDDQEITHRMPEIIDFAELGQFIDLPVRTYSTGMHVRLGFAVASCVNPMFSLWMKLFQWEMPIFKRNALTAFNSSERQGRRSFLSHIPCRQSPDFATSRFGSMKAPAGIRADG